MFREGSEKAEARSPGEGPFELGGLMSLRGGSFLLLLPFPMEVTRLNAKGNANFMPMQDQLQLSPPCGRIFKQEEKHDKIHV